MTKTLKGALFELLTIVSGLMTIIVGHYFSLKFDFWTSVLVGVCFYSVGVLLIKLPHLLEVD